VRVYDTVCVRGGSRGLTTGPHANGGRGPPVSNGKLWSVEEIQASGTGFSGNPKSSVLIGRWERRKGTYLWKYGHGERHMKYLWCGAVEVLLARAGIMGPPYSSVFSPARPPSSAVPDANAEKVCL